MHPTMTASNVHLLIVERRRALAWDERREAACQLLGPLAAFGAFVLAALATLFAAGWISR